ncbi:ISAs1-like element ISAsp2 family transposase [Dolichospermum flos-aquae]|jgi:predicted transposase YbfD/YdcC|uniref:ISAs1-like element ISAsp2 family transposase n=4 Tax=Dolichospermum TaxID=748770 RepID=A0A6H2BZA2_DOLFA|nr:ISAs1-like element ISAsp2 family transposase [Dolichospermum flos-aquae]QJB42914.1 ISAs1-like element ISAsp2 family transposase [Dolichospermum flos-aquae CCAP 1403/13F]QJB42994.1 ISAs1-like element ISAsp2 family transposase [Dolichospermum flos-aquae CCAP 1403/13F]QJB43159.1 ISAs1-like element ISAsp2 family transposase [Dolichospermum flos-aquae CCAP 1403/13F]QJB43381.1 ISAs1-like element ISAsp2 family transposase [Dolichospermum flos-aquae CCAP 1403/13F]QJB43818.1 ISAs1-like element ISAsp
MKLPPKITIVDHFKDLEDKRVERTKRHKLIDIVTIAICAVICGVDSWVLMEAYGKKKEKWLKQFLELPNGIPSHDTFARVFARIDPQQFQNCFLSWIKSINKITEGEVIAIDGKTLRHSYDKGKDKGAIHMVSAWATSNKLVLGQCKVEEKSNEITAIPELIKVLDIAGCLVTIDAMGCQKEIVKSIAEKSGEYIIALKKNQGNLYKNVEEIFKEAISKGFEGFKYSEFHTKEDKHGREEIRHYLMLSDIEERIDTDKKWVNLQSVGMVEYIRKVNGKTKVETGYYISSLTNNAKLLGESVRTHWGIENSLHWVLDVAFREDDCRIRKDNAPQNFAVIRHIAVNLLGKEKSQKLGTKSKQFCAGWDDEYLEKILECI